MLSLLVLIRRPVFFAPSNSSRGKGTTLHFLRPIAEIDDPIAFADSSPLSMMDDGRLNVYMLDNHAKLLVLKVMTPLPNGEYVT